LTSVTQLPDGYHRGERGTGEADVSRVAAVRAETAVRVTESISNK